MKRLGIVGGLGAWAGLHLAETLLRLSAAETDDQFPEFLLLNLPIRGMDHTGVVDADSVKSQIQCAIIRLSRADCTHLVVACNSVSGLLMDGDMNFTGQVIDLIESACSAVKYKRVGVLCSASCKAEGLYEKALQKREVEVVRSTDREQAVIDKAIGDVIRGNRKSLYTSLYPDALQDVATSMFHRGADELVVGCTELAVPLKSVQLPLPAIDAGEQAVKAFLHA